MINFKNLTLATCIGAMSILLAACSDSESTGTTTAKNSAPAKANEAKEPVNPEAPVVMSLPAYELQEDLSVYWEVNNGTEAAFIYNGKAAEPDSIDTIVKSLANGNYFRGTEKLSELFEQYSKTHDEFVKKDLEKTITPLLQEQLEKFGKQPYYKQTLRSNFISMKPYDFEKEEFPLGSDLFVSIEQQLRSASTPNKYKLSNSEQHYVGFIDAREFRLGFANGEKLKSIKVKGDDARAIEAARTAGSGNNLELHVYGYFDKTIKGDAKVSDETRSILLLAQYIELIDKTKPDVVLYRQKL